MAIGAIPAEKRARNVSVAGLLLQVVLSLCLLLLFLFNHSAATFSAFRLMLGGVFIWMALAILYQQRRSVAEESLETERLKKEGGGVGSESIFEQEEEDFLVAQRRLTWLQRWLLPGFVLLSVLYLLVGHFIFWPAQVLERITDDESWAVVEAPSLTMLIAAGVAFIAFLFSRYVSGMTRQPEYRLLKSGSIFLFANALVCLLLTISLGLLSTKMDVPERILAVGIRYLLLILGLEFLVNFVLDFYRPRVADEVSRPAFESRLIGLISEPGGIAKSLADAVNYQFGFEVSATWFYKMLEQAVIPLAALGILVLVGMSSVVVVDADELAVVERFGEPVSSEPVQPGLHFKYPWPVDRVLKAKVGLVQEEVIGEVKVKGTEEKQAPAEAEEVITWTEEHPSVPSVDVLVATSDGTQGGTPQPGDADEEGGAVAVSILRMSLPVHYVVRQDGEGFFDYLYNYADPQTMLRDIAYRELVKQAVHFDYQKIMGEQRKEVTETLHRLIQAKCDEMELGLEIVFVGLQDVHPPTENDVAATFQQVATAEQRRDTLIQSAHVGETRELVGVAGDVRRARKLDALIQEKDQLAVDQFDRRRAIDREIERYMLGDLEAGILPVWGEAGEKIQKARADAQDKVSSAAAKVNTFKLERIAYEASPRLYKTRKVLDALSGRLDNVRKYVLLVDPEKTNIIIELHEQDTSGLEIIESPGSN